MQSVDERLGPASAAAALKELSQHSFVCHDCEKAFAARSNALYYFPERDMVYHRHGNDFFRALRIEPDGSVLLGAFDSLEENVLQCYKLVLAPEQTIQASGDGPNSLIESSRKFFDSMRRQGRKLTNADLAIRIR